MEILHRELKFEGRADETKRTIAAALSSDEPIERSFGFEILSHERGAVDLSRAQPALPLLFNHDPDQPIGSATNVRIEGGKLRADLRFAKTLKGEEIFRLVSDNHISGVSIGYSINKMDQTGERSGMPIYTATKWCIYETSVAPIPADHQGAGIGRSLNFNSGVTMETQNTRIDPAMQGRVLASERERVNELLAAGEQYAKHGGRELAQRAVLEGHDQTWLSAAIMERMTTNPSPSSTDLGLTGSDTKQYSILRAIRAIAENRPQDAGFELECDRTLKKKLGQEHRRGLLVPSDIQRRDLSAGAATAGGYLVGTKNMSFIELLRNASRVQELGATMMPGLTGNVTIPKQSAGATAYWVTEGAAITESQQTFGQLSLVPKTVGALTEITRQLLLQSDPSAEMLVMNDLSKIVALAVDLAAINGSGAAGQPTGVLQTAGIGSVAGASLGWAGVLNFQEDVSSANGLSKTCAYLTTPAVASLMAQRQRFTSTDSPLWAGNLLDGQMAGFRAAATNQVPASTMIFGDWSSLIIGEWSVLELLVNPFGPNFNAGNVLVRAMWSVDIGVRHSGAFSVATSIT